MKAPILYIVLALALITVNALGSILYSYYVFGNINISAVIPRLALVLFLCSMAYLGKNWARLILGLLSVVAFIGILASISLHFYTSQIGYPHPLEFIQGTIYFLVALLLLMPKSVRQQYKSIAKQAA